LIAIQQKVTNGDPLTDTEQALRLASRRIVFGYADLAWNQFENNVITEENFLSAIGPFLAGYTY